MQADGILSDEDFDARLRWVVDLTAQMLGETQGTHYHPTMFLLLPGPDGEPAWQLASLSSMPDLDERVAAFRALGAQLGQNGLAPLAVFICSEAWMTELAPDVQPDPAAVLRPSFDPARREVISFLGGTPDGRLNSANAPMLRSANGNIRLAGATYVPAAGQAERVQSPLLAALFEGLAGANQP